MEDRSTRPEQLYPFLLKVYACVDKTKRSKIDAPDLCKFNIAQDVDRGYYLAAAIVRQPNAFFSYDQVDAHIKASPTDGEPQPLVPDTLRSCVFRLCHYSLMVGHPGERWIYKSMWLSFTGLTWKVIYTLLCLTAHGAGEADRNKMTTLTVPSSTIEAAMVYHYCCTYLLLNDKRWSYIFPGNDLQAFKIKAPHIDCRASSNLSRTKFYQWSAV